MHTHPSSMSCKCKHNMICLHGEHRVNKTISPTFLDQFLTAKVPTCWPDDLITCIHIPHLCLLISRPLKCQHADPIVNKNNPPTLLDQFYTSEVPTCLHANKSHTLCSNVLNVIWPLFKMVKLVGNCTVIPCFTSNKVN